MLFLATFPIQDRPAGGWSPLLSVIVVGLLIAAAAVYLVRAGNPRAHHRRHRHS